MEILFVVLNVQCLFLGVITQPFYDDLFTFNTEINHHSNASNIILERRENSVLEDTSSNIGDTFHSIYESVLFNQQTHVNFTIKSETGFIYFYDIVCDNKGHCKIKVQSKIKDKKGSPKEALSLFLSEPGELAFINPEINTKSASSQLINTIKETNPRLKLVDDTPCNNNMERITTDQKNKFIREVLEAHNEYRQRHHAQPLHLEQTLMKAAQTYADDCAMAQKIKPRNELLPYGENIWGLVTNDPNFNVNGSRPVDKWYSEVEYYHFGQEPLDSKSGHFTQVVWNDTKYLGVGLASNDKGQIYVVCEYHPPGNYLGSYAKEVLPVEIISEDDDDKETVTEKPHKDKEEEEHTEDGVKGLRLDVLRGHNEKRAIHGAQPLTYSKELEELAQEWAEHLIEHDTFQHRPNNSYGENIFYRTGSQAISDTEAVNHAIKSWYDEIKFYQPYFNEEPSVEVLTGGDATGHFTQLIWNGTTSVGVGLARTNVNNKVMVVANYGPAGNILGQFRKNVFPPIKIKKK